MYVLFSYWLGFSFSLVLSEFSIRRLLRTGVMYLGENNRMEDTRKQ